MKPRLFKQTRQVAVTIVVRQTEDMRRKSTGTNLALIIVTASHFAIVWL